MITNNGDVNSDDSKDGEPITMYIDDDIDKDAVRSYTSETDALMSSVTDSNGIGNHAIRPRTIEIPIKDDTMDQIGIRALDEKKAIAESNSMWQLSDKISFDLKSATSSIKIINKRPRRTILKSGDENISQRTNPQKSLIKYLNDAINTMIEFRWRWVIFWFIFCHVLTWFVFAVLWYIGSLAHGDFDLINPPLHPCIEKSKTFLAVFLMSFETQTSIGFGDRVVNEQCPEAIFLMMMQLVFATGMIGVMTSVMLMKMTAPQNHNREGIGFSKNAVICMRDGKLCLMFRVWDLQQKHIISTAINVYLLRKVRTAEGENVENYATRLNLFNRGAFLIWPITVVHVIDETSPFYELSSADLPHCKFEVVVCLSGASVITALTSQSQTSYLPKEIFWGFRFKNVIRFCPSIGSYAIDIDYLNSLEQVKTPHHSARRVDDIFAEELESRRRRQHAARHRPLHASASFPLLSPYSRPKWLPSLSSPLEGVATDGQSGDY